MTIMTHLFSPGGNYKTRAFFLMILKILPICQVVIIFAIGKVGDD